MFVYSLRAGTLKLAGIAAVALLLLVSLIIFVPNYDADTGEKAEPAAVSDGVSYEKIKTNEDRVKFLSEFGWTADSEPTEVLDVTVPAEFDKIFTGYNEIQKRQGLDLSKYKNKDLTRYTYTVTNYPEYSGKVYANLLMYKNKVVGGDICSAEPIGSNAFAHGFELTK